METDLTANGRRERGTNFDLRDGKPVWIDYILGPASKSWKATADAPTDREPGRRRPVLRSQWTLLRRHADAPQMTLAVGALYQPSDR